MRQLFPTAREVSLDLVHADLSLPDGTDARPGVAINMVSTVDGKVALNGSAAGIGSRTDRRMMRLIRAAADAVMVAAGTLRVERVDPRVSDDLAERRVGAGRPGQPLAIAISASLDLDPSTRFFVNGPDRTVVLTAENAPRDRAARLERHAQLVRAGTDVVDLPEGLRRLRTELGVERLLVEGGPSLDQALLDHDLLDEVFWTIAPKLAGGAGLTMIQADAPATAIVARLSLRSLYEHEGELFARYGVERSGRADDADRPLRGASHVATGPGRG